MKVAITPREKRLRWILGLVPILLLFPSPVLSSKFESNHLDVVNSSSLSTGDYARYTESNLSLSYLVSYRGGLGADYAANQVYLADYETHFPYSSLTVGWKIESVRPASYLMNYTVSLSGLQGDVANGGRIVENVVVSRQNGTVYSVNGTALGSWPYWLAGQYLVPGATLTLIHRFGEFVFNQTFNGLAYFTDTAFTSLPQGTGVPNKTATQDFLDSSLNLGPQGTFITDRLLVTYPYFRFFPCGPAMVPARCTFSNPIWVGVYDRPSGILLAQDHNFWFIDDILLHSGLGIGQIGFHGLSLVLSSTNLNLGPDSRPGGTSVWVLAAAVVAAISVFGVAAASVLRRHSRGERR
jgi:hypothetical protein